MTSERTSRTSTHPRHDTTRFESTRWGTPLGSLHHMRDAARAAGYAPLQHQHKEGIEIHAHPNGRRVFMQNNGETVSVLEHRVPVDKRDEPLGGTVGRRSKPRLLSGMPTSRSPLTRRR